MDEFGAIYEQFNEEPDPEYALADKLKDEIEGLVDNLKAEFWFDPHVLYNVDKAMEWIRTHSPELYEEALKDPSKIEGRDEVSDALMALGYMEVWTNMREEDLENPEDIECWRIATGYYRYRKILY